MKVLASNLIYTINLIIFLTKTLVQAIKHMMHKINTVLLCRHLGCHTSTRTEPSVSIPARPSSFPFFPPRESRIAGTGKSLRRRWLCCIHRRPPRGAPADSGIGDRNKEEEMLKKVEMRKNPKECLTEMSKNGKMQNGLGSKMV